MFEEAFLKLAIGLVILIAVNIILGSVHAIFDKEFDWKTCGKGLIKGGIVVICALALYYAGALNPEIIAVNINGQDFTILSAINAVALVAFGFYATQVFAKLIVLLKGKATVEEVGMEGKE